MTHVAGDAALGTAPGNASPAWNSPQAGDIAHLMVEYNQGTATPNLPSGFTLLDTHTYSASMEVRYYAKTCLGTEGAGTLGVSLTGGTQKFAAALTIRRGEQFPVSGMWAWADEASGLSATLAEPAVTTSKTVQHFSFWACRGSTPPTAVTSVPAGNTLVDSAFGTGGGACCAAISYNNTIETDGSVGAGNWVRNNSASAGTVVLTVATELTPINSSPSGVGSGEAMGSHTATVLSAGTDVTPTGIATAVAVGTINISPTNVALTGIATGAAVGTPTAGSALPPTVFTYPLFFPFFGGHRGGNPGPEETLQQYFYMWALGHHFFLECDMQVLNDGTTIVLCHDDTIDRTASASSPITTGTVETMSPAQWATVILKANSGFTAADAPAMFLSDFTPNFGPSSGRWAVILAEVKQGSDATACINAIYANNLQTQTIVNGYNLSDVVEARLAGLEACYQTNVPDFDQLVTLGINHISIDRTFVTAPMCTEAHSKGIKVWAYTVNSTGNRDTFLAAGGDGLIGNNPWSIDDGFTMQSGNFGIATAKAAGTPAIATTITCGPSGVASGVALGNPTLSGSTTVTPTGFDDPDALGTQVISTLLTSTPMAIPTAEGFGPPSLSTQLTSTPNGVASGEALGAHALSGQISLVPAGIATAAVLGVLGLTTLIGLTPSGVATAAALGNPTLNASVVLTPTGIATAESLGLISILGNNSIGPSGIVSSEALGNITLGGQVSLSPSGVGSGVALGNPSAGANLSSSPTGVSSGEVAGPVVISTLVTLSPTGIVTGVAIGDIGVRGTLDSRPDGVVGGAALGMPELSALLAAIPASIDSLAAAGTPSLTSLVQIVPVAIPGQSAIGGLGAVTLYVAVPSGVASQLVMGDPSVELIALISFIFYSDGVTWQPITSLTIQGQRVRVYGSTSGGWMPLA